MVQTITIATRPQCEIVATLCQTHDCLSVDELFWILVGKEAQRLATANANGDKKDAAYAERRGGE